MHLICGHGIGSGEDHLVLQAIRVQILPLAKRQSLPAILAIGWVGAIVCALDLQHLNRPWRPFEVYPIGL
jgi:hypothetical protein